MSELKVSNLRKEHGKEGPDLVGITTLTSQHYMVPPSGTTKERPENPEAGTLRYNTDTGNLEYFRGGQLGWETIHKKSYNLGGAATSGSIDGTGARAIFSGGYTPAGSPNSCFNNVDALTLATLGNTIDFNNLTANLVGGSQVADSTRCIYAGGRGPLANGTAINEIQYCTFSTQADYVDGGGNLTSTWAYGVGLGDKTRGLIAGKSVPGYVGTVDYITIQSVGQNAQDFGDLHTAKGYCFGMSSSTRGIIAAGLYCCPGVTPKNIEYVNIQTTGSFVDFGDMTTGRYEGGSMANGIRGIFAAGYGPNYTNKIDYINMASKGDAVEFGRLTNVAGTGKYAANSPTRGVIGGGYNSGSDTFSTKIDYIELTTLGNSQDFGDFQGFGRRSGNGDGATSNAHGGL